ncbi:RadC family protein [Oceanicella actignis]|uniref:DNA repair protein RadC n=1 Tax=Oceanicella actignis TaxID=1189325 RepID=A0A1M7RVE2_9RHOB|nr:DNA repair protein RadC [Oceanicella actignis]TYO89913.1 DNA repair protein RadC [Oceanicella actignis]SET02071.1 DNA repair protein RadC [Oceanicella actignis]SHN50201.1 DNA repair protein RadC [Oceanicella actignis]
MPTQHRRFPTADAFAEAPQPGLFDAAGAAQPGEARRARTAGADGPRAPSAAPAPAAIPDPAAAKAPDEPWYADHRERLRERFMRRGADALDDYELLELILFRAIPRQDVKPLAKRLIRAFGDFNHAISAPPERLAEVRGAGKAVIRELKIVEAAAHRLAQARVLGREAISSWDALVAYLRQRLAHERTEQFRVLYLDRKNVLIADEAQQRGTVDHVPVYPREVVKRALALEASALILVHNHPSGDPTPSQSDIDMTHRIVLACESMGLRVHDHVIVGKDRVASFHEMGLLD